MTKDITFRSMQMFGGRIKFNHEVKTATSDPGEDDLTEFYPVAIQFYCTALGNGSANRRIEDTITLGSKRETEYTPNEIYTKVKNVMGQDIADVIKDLYIEALNEDISQ